MRDTRGVSPTRVQVVTVDVGAAVAAADAAEGGDGVSVAVAVAEKEKGGSLLQEQTRHKAVAHLFIAAFFSTCTSLCCLSCRVPSPLARLPRR